MKGDYMKIITSLLLLILANQAFAGFIMFANPTRDVNLKSGETKEFVLEVEHVMDGYSSAADFKKKCKKDCETALKRYMDKNKGRFKLNVNEVFFDAATGKILTQKISKNRKISQTSIVPYVKTDEKIVVLSPFEKKKISFKVKADKKLKGDYLFSFRFEEQKDLTGLKNVVQFIKVLYGIGIVRITDTEDHTMAVNKLSHKYIKPIKKTKITLKLDNKGNAFVLNPAVNLVVLDGKKLVYQTKLEKEEKIKRLMPKKSATFKGVISKKLKKGTYKAFISVNDSTFTVNKKLEFEFQVK
jgi:hypothetical protein